jgi:hypothetical protein
MFIKEVCRDNISSMFAHIGKIIRRDGSCSQYLKIILSTFLQSEEWHYLYLPMCNFWGLSLYEWNWYCLKINMQYYIRSKYDYDYSSVWRCVVENVENGKSTPIFCQLA